MCVCVSPLYINIIIIMGMLHITQCINSACMYNVMNEREREIELGGWVDGGGGGEWGSR